jgi:hypothetical protein
MSAMPRAMMAARDQFWEAGACWMDFPMIQPRNPDLGPDHPDTLASACNLRARTEMQAARDDS